MRRQSIVSILLAAMAPVASPALAISPSSPPGERSPPNIVFILADDLGQRDVGVYGSSYYETPNLDRLAARGMRFTQAYAASNVCSPTRASLLTGRYPARLGITDWLPGRAPHADEPLCAPAMPDHLDPNTPTLAHAFHGAGYKTAFIGKWHLGGQPEHLPDRHGFDVNIAGSGLGHPPSYFSPYRLPHLPDGPQGEQLDDRLTREAISFITRSVRESRPFLLYLAHYAVHNPLQAKPELAKKFAAKLAAHPVSGPVFDETGPDGKVRVRQTNETYAAMVANLDASVGTLLAALDQLGISENTLVIFTSDNGGLSTAEGFPTSNAPLRAGKGWPYEGGVREPLIVAWPGHIAAGNVNDAIVTSPDFFPTLIDLAGLPAHRDEAMDGRSFAPALLGQSTTLPDRPIFWHYPHYSNQRGRPHSAMREGRWKLIEWLETGRVELFDLPADPGESHDLAKGNPNQAAALLAELRAWRTRVGARLPTPNPDYRPAP